MAENESGQDAGPAQPAAEGQTQAPPIVIRGQYVKDLSFENPGAPQTLMQMNPPEIEINVNVDARSIAEGGDFEVTLSISGHAKHGETSVFVVELVYAGLFRLNNVPQDSMRPLLLIECPRLLFPFARNIIADATREGGFPPLLIQPLDFVALYQQQFANQPPTGTA